MHRDRNRRRVSSSRPTSPGSPARPPSPPVVVTSACLLCQAVASSWMLWRRHRVTLLSCQVSTDLVPSETACFESSPERIRRTAIRMPGEEMVEHAANSDRSLDQNGNHEVKQHTEGFPRRCARKHRRRKSSEWASRCRRHRGQEGPGSAGIHVRVHTHRGIGKVRLTLVDARRASLLAGLARVLLLARVFRVWWCRHGVAVVPWRHRRTTAR